MRFKVLLAVLLVLIIGGGAWFASQSVKGVKPTTAPLARFAYSHRGTSTDSFYSYEIKESGDSYTFCFLPFRQEDEQTVNMSREDAAVLLEIINRHDLWKWHGFSQTDPNILDGTSFSLRIVFADGTAIEANGSNWFPSSYSAACADMDTLFSKYIKEPEQ